MTTKQLKQEIECIVRMLNSCGSHIVFTHRYDYYCIDRLMPGTTAIAESCSGMTLKECYYFVLGLWSAISMLK